jgi:hypothetical protein
MGRLAAAAGLESGPGSGGPARVSSSYELGLDNSAIRSQERRSGLGVGLTEMYI